MGRPPVIFQRTYVTAATADLRKTYIRDTIVVDDTGPGVGDFPLLLPKIGTAYAPVGLRITVVKASNATHAVAITPAALDAVSSGTPGAFPDFGAPGIANSSALSTSQPGSVTLEATDMNLVGSVQPNPAGGTPTTAGAWLAIGSGTGGGSTSDLPFSHALYVDGGTTTLPADADGSDERPFKTIMAAVSHLADNTAIILMPSVYNENVDWGAFGDFDNTALIGLTETSCIIAPTSGDAFSWTPGAAASIANFNLSGVTLRVLAGNRALKIDGNATPNLFTRLAIFQNLIIDHPGGSDSVFVRRANQVNLVNVKNLTFGATRFTNVSQGIIQDFFLTNDEFVVTWDDTLPIPVQGRSNCAFVSGVQGRIVMDVSPFVIINRNVIVLLGIVGTNLAVNGGNGPILVCAGTIGLFGVINGGINLALPDAPGGQVQINIAGSDIAGDTSIATAGPTRLPIQARGVVWRQTNAASVVFGDFLDTDTRDSSFANQAIFSVLGTSTFDRDRWGIYGVPDFAVATPVTISPPFPAGITDYVVTPNPTNPVAVAIPPGLKTNSQFTATPSAATGVTDFMAVRAQAT